MDNGFKNIDEYIAAYPANVKRMLQILRQTIKSAASGSEEVISYSMPAFRFHGILVYFAAYKNHIGFYPGASPIVAFQKELSVYKGAKGSVQFPLDKPLPLDLIAKIIAFRIKENLEREKAKNSRIKRNELSRDNAGSKAVDNHIEKLEPTLGKIVQQIRKSILHTSSEIGERIKWNNPSFYFIGKMKAFDPKEYKREIAVFNLSKGRIMLVFPSGAKVNDTNGLLVGDYDDGRRIIVFKDLKDFKEKEKIFQQVIKKWIKLVDK
jgi:uncharacterized protein YdhG (YjbR/CyaY superfamily)